MVEIMRNKSEEQKKRGDTEIVFKTFTFILQSNKTKLKFQSYQLFFVDNN